MENKKIQVNRIGLNDIKQTQINDKGNEALCTALCNILQAGAMQGLVYTLADVDRIVDACVANGALRTADGVDSDGYINSHRKMAEACGLTGFRKIYRAFDANELITRIVWGQPVELRDDGHHSLLALGVFEEGGKAYADVLDPWGKTNDQRLDITRQMTQRQVALGKWVDSRSIERIGYYKDASQPLAAGEKELA